MKNRTDTLLTLDDHTCVTHPLQACLDQVGQATQRLAAENAELTSRAELAETRIADLESQRTQLISERDAALQRAHAADQARISNAELSRQLGDVLAEARAATERAECAETRHDQLVATLSDLAHRGASTEGDPA
ncbi:hypothetical protein [Couchioplanes azureus]|uniref:hypothetical protein n=1 Tax=Couchioplanes caeruleus TaxID=56438 RepID=UPI001670B720|nr:hypothetical protein [Couchioplanes caeruleus]GGQ84075.1 hypothetical protein GCM10010166_62900 [Couchioplanes caeruleus subsp. azureus]